MQFGYLLCVPSLAKNPFKPLIVHRNFRLFWTGQTLSLVGTWMQNVAQGWLALELSNSAFIVGAVSAAQALPVLLFTMYAGVVADRYNKYKVIMLGQIILLAQAIILWGVVSAGHVNIAWLLALASVNGIVTAFETPTRQSFIVDLVGKEDLIEAIALNSSGFNLARIIGPSIAAIVISSFGLKWCFALNAISYFAVLIGLLMMKLPKWIAVISEQSPAEGIRQGMLYIKDTPQIFTIIKMVAVFSVFGMPFMTLMPVMARDVLNSGASGYGLLLTCVGVGALTGALTLAAIGRKFRGGPLYLSSAFVFGGLVSAFTLTRSHTVALVLVTLIGFAMILNSALANSILQSIAPDELRGRVVAAYVLVYIGLMPVGSLLLGWLANVLAVDQAIAIGASLMIVFAFWTLVRHPEMRAIK